MTMFDKNGRRIIAKEQGQKKPVKEDKKDKK